MKLTFIERIKSLQVPVRSLLYLYFIYAFTGGLVGIFIQIKIFKMFPDLFTNVISGMFFYTGIMFGFCFFGYIVSHFRLDAKQGFYYSFVSFAVGLFMISQANTSFLVYLAMFIYGLGAGFFWLTVHTYELTETKDMERDFYSSVLTAGRLFISIFAPLCATGLIWLSANIFHLSSFWLLFMVAPFFYLLGLFCFKGIKEYRPERIEFADITHFFSEKRNRLAQLYLAGGGSQHLLADSLIPLTLFYILGTELRVGIYATIGAIFSIIFVIILGQFRNQGNRILLFTIAGLAMSLLTVFLGNTLTFIALIIFTIGAAILSPIISISDHVVSLQTIESIGRLKKDFYATMILRDFSLWIWRMFAGVILLVICQFYNNSSERLSLGLYMLAFMGVITFIGAKILVDKLHVKNLPSTEN